MYLSLIFQHLPFTSAYTRVYWGFPSGLVEKNPLAMQEIHETRFDPWVGKILWSRAWQPTPVFLPGESHSQKSVVGYSP